MSLSLHLILRLTLVSLLLVGGGSWLAYKDVQHEVRELFDAQLARSARLILSMVQAGGSIADISSIQSFLEQNRLNASTPAFGEEYSEGDEDLETGHSYETKLGFQIWDSYGNLLLRSPNVPITPLSGKAVGYSNEQIDDNEWRVFALTSKDSRYRCVTAERVDVRNDLIGKISSDLLLLFFVLIAALAVTMWLATRQGLTSLHRLAAHIENRDPDNLEPIPQQDAPAEILTINRAINKLLAELDNALSRERRITSDAAHELRTPLAAVKLHAELASTADNRQDRIEAIEHVMQGIDRTTHLVEQLLALARLDPGNAETEPEAVDLCRIAVEEAALLAPLAENKHIELSVDSSGAMHVLGEEMPLRLLVRNLIDNAIIYTQPGGEVGVTFKRIQDRPCFVITDNGPGIPETERERVLQRFYRAANHDQPGCGIGLSIVKRVTEMCDAALSMHEPAIGTGLVVRICFQHAR